MIRKILGRIFCWPMLLPINILLFSAFFGYMLMSWQVFYWTAGSLFVGSWFRPLRPVMVIAWLSMWAIIMYKVEVAFLAEFSKHRLNACFYGLLYNILLPFWCIYGLGSILRGCKFMQPYTHTAKPSSKPFENITEDDHAQTQEQSSQTPNSEPEPAPFEPHKVLEVSPNATTDEIKSSYRKLILQYHPDRVQHLGQEFQELAHKRTLEIQRAYELLNLAA